MICWSGGSRGSGLYIVAIQGASPSGLWLVVGRDDIPPLVPGRLTGDCPEAVRLDCEVLRCALVLRLDVPGVDFAGAFPFTGDFGDVFLEVGLFRSPSGGVRVPFDNRGPSNNTWLEMLPLLSLNPLVVMVSPFHPLLPFRDRVCPSPKACPTGSGLVFATGILDPVTGTTGMRDVLGLIVCCRWA